jgi:hypothetical protein
LLPKTVHLILLSDILTFSVQASGIAIGLKDPPPLFVYFFVDLKKNKYASYSNKTHILLIESKIVLSILLLPIYKIILSVRVLSIALLFGTRNVS